MSRGPCRRPDAYDVQVQETAWLFSNTVSLNAAWTRDSCHALSRILVLYTKKYTVTVCTIFIGMAVAKFQNLGTVLPTSNASHSSRAIIIITMRILLRAWAVTAVWLLLRSESVVADAPSSASSALHVLKNLDYRYFVAGGTCAAISHGLTTPIDVVRRCVVCRGCRGCLE